MAGFQLTKFRIPLSLKSRTNRRLNVILGLLSLCFFSLFWFPTLTSINGDFSTQSEFGTPVVSEYSAKHGGLSYAPKTFNNIGNMNGYFANAKIKNVHDFYYKLFNAISKARPVTPPKDKMAAYRKEGCKIKDVASYDKKENFSLLSYSNLDECFKLSDSQTKDLQVNHERFVNFIDTDIAEMDPAIKEQLWPNEKGIVIVGGGKFSIISINTIKAIRERGSTLPIEVIIPRSSVPEEEYCNRFLPSFNAKCVYLDDTLPNEFKERLTLKKYQYKSFALLVSSFKNVLYIDADNIPLVNLDNIFDSKAYKDNGLITWPDIWRRVTAPAYYKIANINYNLDNRVRYMADDVTPTSYYDNIVNPGNNYKLRRTPFHDFEGTLPDLTSESGQLMVNKETHFRTLLLAFYYNYYGPRWYYTIFSQGTSGEGDKETFLAAAHALGEPYYQVKSTIEFDGYFDHKDGFQGIGLYQKDFNKDYENYLAAKAKVEKDKKYGEYNPNYDFDADFEKALMNPPGNEVEAMFIHVSFHKFDPHNLAKNKRYILQGKQYRVFSKFKNLRNWDLELEANRNMHFYLCTDNAVEFIFYKDLQGKDSWKDMCNYLSERVEYLASTHDAALSGELKIGQPPYVEEPKEEPKEEEKPVAEGETKNQEAKNEEAKNEETKKDETKKDETKKDETKKDETKKEEEVKKEEPKKEEPKKEEPKKEEANKK
ncbi:hypothetical protein TPHA_0E03480 [Tetrapisispora phaffii CBS 4417]|uniref:Uncharacterized protein n=1 Tax=Tetrapisispora phaffii (strain ATCC 24235 / CBS 4417 / NBRC 1672 / NRRL Y-8282 / UCD 70-5) TaxID=1071381 RepID=G8BU60_TETPH|nr:hypothetical protein TPHA_0E03480 [Tetrapisispora phaffii CBS 4417]CCE63438.1 hypothetical protein TPHA_0E03480 [Tetrapisispora phaffii CBS 4417]